MSSHRGPLLRGVFVTGTDTGVGKTVVSAALLHKYRRAGAVRYWKPIQTGIDEEDDTATVVRLSGCEPGEVLDAGVRLPRALSPHLAARAAGVSIDPDGLMAMAAAQSASVRWIVEGAGGALVPINDDWLMIDLVAGLGLPALVVSRTTLGTINHTLLTVEALRARAIAVAGVMMVGDRSPDNREAIERYGRVPVVAEIPTLKPLTASAVRRAASTLDCASLLGVDER